MMHPLLPKALLGKGYTPEEKNYFYRMFFKKELCS